MFFESRGALSGIAQLGNRRCPRNDPGAQAGEARRGEHIGNRDGMTGCKRCVDEAHNVERGRTGFE